MAENECELKLIGHGSAIRSLRKDAGIKARTLGPVSTKRLVSAYFDTPNNALRSAGAVLRIREKNGSFVQTLKSDASAGGLIRREVEEPVGSLKPNIDMLVKNGYGDLIGRTGSGKKRSLKHKFTTDIQRTERLILGPSDSIIELVIDDGIIKTDGGAAPLEEVELELKSGSPVAVVDAARTLVEQFDLSVSLVSKAERGYALSRKARQKPVKAAPIQLDGTMKAGDAFRVVIASCLDHLTRNEPFARAGQSDGLHQMRVALRRMRSAFRCFAGVIDEASGKHWDERARSLANAFGPARDLDVFVADILTPAQAELEVDYSFALIGAVVANHRETAWNTARMTLESTEYRLFLLDLARSMLVDLVGKSARRPVTGFARTVLNQCFRRAAKRGRKIDTLSIPERHELRKDLKKLRYTAEFFSSLFSKQNEKRFF